MIEHPEALIYMLCEAAELEQGIMCQYLFAAFSLKQDESEGLSGTELDIVRRWRKQVSHVATQEMLHLALVQNVLSAIGAAPHMSRPNLPAPASHYPAGAWLLALLPFGEQALRHFMFLERPEGMDLDDADGLAAVAQAAPLMTEQDIVPRGQDFATIGHLVPVDRGRRLPPGWPKSTAKTWLFGRAAPGAGNGPPLRLAGAACRRDGPVSAPSARSTRSSEQGEGPSGHWRNAHFGQFVKIPR